MTQVATKRFGAILIILATLALSACTQMFFYPQKQHFNVPLDFGYTYQDIALQTSDDLTLHAWLVDPNQEVIGTVYFLHGNAENISTHIRAVLWLVDLGYQVLALDYRGYGQSAGTAKIPEVFEDIQAGAEWLEQHLQATDNQQPVYLLGQSLGASLAISYAEQQGAGSELFDALIVEAAFTRYGTIAKHVASQHWLTWLFQYPAKWLFAKQYDPLDAIGKLSPLPVLLIHSPGDEVIPYALGERLFKEAGEPKQFIQAEGRHIWAFAEKETRQAVHEFMVRNSRE
ncbi:MAG: alpha/beta fold hydrolase [Granulosicoccus sp.]